jgi:threonine dehydrogenase-like Zn-dependent dehydrogenase
MTHSDKDIEAAKEYAVGKSSAVVFQEAHINDFLAGCEHKQKEVDEKQQEIDELVWALEKGKLMMENIIEIYKSTHPEEGIELYEQLIQKHKR